MIDFESLPSDKCKWPFRNMNIGETIPMNDMHGKTIFFVQRTVHRYASESGKKFKTKTSDGVLYVKRVS